MSLWRGSLLATIVRAAATAAASVPVCVVLPDCYETFPDYGSILEAAEYAWLQG